MESETVPNYERLPSRALAPAPAADKKPFLVIDLADLTEDEEKQVVTNIDKSVKDEDGNGPSALIQLWRPPESAFLSPPRNKHKYLFKEYHRDSKANLYGLAVLAYRAGYNFYFALDRYFVNGDGRFSKGIKTRNGVMVNIRTHTSGAEMKIEDSLRIFARRFEIGETSCNLHGDDHDILASIEEFEATVVDDYDDDIMEDDSFETHHYDWGIELHDPSRGVFVSSMTTMTGRDEFETARRDVLLKCIKLPLEIVDQIVDLLYDGDEPVFGVPSIIRAVDVNIFLLFPTTENEHLAIQSTIQQEVERCIETQQSGEKEHEMVMPENLTVQLIPWKYDRTATRLDLERYCQHLGGLHACPLYFLLEPLKDGQSPDYLALSPKSSPLGGVHRGVGDVTLAIRTTMADMILNFCTRPPNTSGAVGLRRGLSQGQHHQGVARDVEIMHQPEQPLYTTYDGLEDSGIDSKRFVRVLFLASMFKLHGVRELMNEITADGDGLDSVACCQDAAELGIDVDAPDGGIHKMWRVFCELQSEGCRPPYFFADRRSVYSLKLIMVGRDVIADEDAKKNVRKSNQPIYDPTLQGLQYGRIRGRKAWKAWKAISSGEKKFADFFNDKGKIRTWPRPDLAGSLT